MPREVIRANGLDSDTDALNPSISVGWSKQGYVQIGTCRDGANGVDGLFLDLDRGGINSLIRLLRKARDQAFGADA